MTEREGASASGKAMKTEPPSPCAERPQKTGKEPGQPAVAVQATPLPRKQMIVLTVVLLTEAVCGSMLLPFVPRFIAFLKHVTVEEAGYYSGVLVGLFMLGQVVSSKLWGYMSDTYGRKVPLSSGLLAGGLAMLFFGYTKSFVVCCILRFLHGFFNGNVLVAKTVIADITDSTNQAKGFAMVSITWGVGNLFGPIVGGFLYNPTHKSYLNWLAGGSLHSFFADYPAFLPSFTIFLYTMVALLCCVFMLRETNPHRKAIRDTLLGRKLLQFFDRARGKTASATDVVVATSPTAAETSTSATDTGKPCQAVSDDVAVDRTPALPSAAVSSPGLQRKLTYAQAMRIDALRNITLFYMLLSGSDMTYGEIFPLWGNADQAAKGMGLTENAVSILMLSYSIPSIVANLYFHRVCALFSNQYIVFWRYSLAMYTAATILIPLGSRMGGAGYYYVMLLGMARQVGLSWCYSLIHMLTAKAAPLGCVGSVYGISQSLAAATRCAVPFIVAPLFAWSLQDGHVFPFNYYLVFIISAIPAAVSVVMSFYVHITRSEAPCEADSEGAAAIAVPDASCGGVRTPRDGSDRDGSSGDEGSDIRESVYMSLVSSFCTNPLHDTYVNMEELKRENADAAHEAASHRGARAGEHRPAVAAARTATMAQDEDRRHVRLVHEELPTL